MFRVIYIADFNDPTYMRSSASLDFSIKQDAINFCVEMSRIKTLDIYQQNPVCILWDGVSRTYYYDGAVI